MFRFISLTKVHVFLGSAKEQFEVLNTMYKQLDSQYKTLAKYYCFDLNKYSVEEFFGDIKVFKDGFLVRFSFCI
jgi:diaphanous 2